MNRRISRLVATTALAGSLLLAAVPAALAYGDGGGSWGGYGGARAVSYINPDIGAATANPSVNADSSCFKPDQYDQQDLSTSTVNRNVHNDACFLDGNGKKVNGPASFQSRGVGFIVACPDPDGAGPQFARLTDTNGDGRNDLCFQSAYQTKGVAGDFEFHARLNNSTTNGTQYVTWCSDSDANGCDDEWNKSQITIDWGTSSSSGGWSR